MQDVESVGISVRSLRAGGHEVGSLAERVGLEIVYTYR